MIVIKNKFIPFEGYETINLFGILFTRGYVDKFEYNHENIHTQQLIECFIAGAAFIFAICIFISFKFTIFIIPKPVIIVIPIIKKVIIVFMCVFLNIYIPL